MSYLLDANTFIEAKNRYYHMAICPGYWQWLQLKHQTSEVLSIDGVADELLRGDDEPAEWVAVHKAMFLPVSDNTTQLAFSKIAAYIAAESPRMKSGAMEEFLAGADPWLVAKAMVTGSTVVTHEAFNLETKKKFLIPNLCRQFNVRYMDTFQLLHTLKAEFVLADCCSWDSAR